MSHSEYLCIAGFKKRLYLKSWGVMAAGLTADIRVVSYILAESHSASIMVSAGWQSLPSALPGMPICLNRDVWRTADAVETACPSWLGHPGGQGYDVLPWHQGLKEY